MWGGFSGQYSVNPSTDGIDGEISSGDIESVLKHLVWLDGHEDWKGSLVNSHEFSELLLDSNSSVGVGEEDLSLVCGGSLSKKLNVGSIFIILRSEENKGVLLLSEDSLNFVLSEFEKGWYHEWLEPGIKGFLISSTSVDVFVLFESSEENFSWGRDTVVSSASSISGVVE